MFLDISARKLAMAETMIEQLNPGIPDIAGNKQFIKIREVTPQEYLHLKLVYADTQFGHQEQLVMHRIVTKFNELLAQNQAKEEAAKTGERVYVRNARGAKIAAALATGMTVAVLAVAVRLGV